MRLMINHQTHYSYSDPVRRSIQYIKMTPINNVHQQVQYWDVSVPGEKETKRDAFNNIWMTSTQHKTYQNMTIMAQGIVVLDVNRSTGIDDMMNPKIFLQPTSITQCDDVMKCFAEHYVRVKDRFHLIQLAEALLEHMPYKQNQTSVQTSAIDAFRMQRGVCQDHTHVFIAMCKYLGLAARYASGYLYVPEQTHLASHAWAEVYIDETWYCFDISNSLFTPQAHIYVAIGRDYWDVAPVRGMRANGGIESMNSIVQVLRC